MKEKPETRSNPDDDNELGALSMLRAPLLTFVLLFFVLPIVAIIVMLLEWWL